MKSQLLKSMNTTVVKLVMLLIFPIAFFSFSTSPNITTEVVAQDSVSYVVQVKKHTNVAVINSFKKKLMGQYPDKKFVTTVQAPNYILSIGYFATEAQATDFKKSIEKEYPDAVVLPYEKK
jgi:ABC-type transporter MlaC component